MSYDNHALDLTVKSDSDQFLVLSEIYYPAGWKAYLDEIEIPIHKTNYVLRGVEVPAGEHTISMRLEPTSFIWGSRLSWIGNSLILLLGVVAFIPRNNVVSENAAA
jgi:uncharacterized membrane protein YfhO